MIMLTGATELQADEFASRRADMLRSIEADMARHADVMGCSRLSDPVARAMSRVPRHLFVPARLRGHAYDNTPLPIGHGQTISQPTIVALMTELLTVAPGDTVLEVGTGSGYQAAVLAETGAVVHSIEIVPELAVSAGNILEELGYDRVMVYCGDGYAGLPEAAPFDAIMVTAAPPELPAALLRQLKPGGRLVAPVGPMNQTQWLTLWCRLEDGRIEKKMIIPVRFVPMVEGEGE